MRWGALFPATREHPLSAAKTPQGQGGPSKGLYASMSHQYGVFNAAVATTHISPLLLGKLRADRLRTAHVTTRPPTAWAGPHAIAEALRWWRRWAKGEACAPSGMSERDTLMGKTEIDRLQPLFGNHPSPDTPATFQQRLTHVSVRCGAQEVRRLEDLAVVRKRSCCGEWCRYGCLRALVSRVRVRQLTHTLDGSTGGVHAIGVLHGLDGGRRET